MGQSDDKLAHGTTSKKRTSKTPRGRKYMHRKANRKMHSTNGMNIKSRVTYNHTTQCEHVNGLCPGGWLNEQSITMRWFQSVRTCPYSWTTGRNSRTIRS